MTEGRDIKAILDAELREELQWLAGKGCESVHQFIADTQDSRGQPNVAADHLEARALLVALQLHTGLKEKRLSPDAAALAMYDVAKLHQAALFLRLSRYTIDGIKRVGGGAKGGRSRARAMPTRATAQAVVAAIREPAPWLPETEVKQRAAKQLGISKSTLYKLLKD